MGWRWGAPWGLEVGVGTDESRHSSPGSWLWTLHQSRHPLCPQPFSCPLSRRCPFDPHSVIVLPLDLLRLRSPGGRQPLFSLSLLSSSLPHPSSGSLSFRTSASQPHVLSIPTLPDPWVSLKNALKTSHCSTSSPTHLLYQNPLKAKLCPLTLFFF